MEKKRFSCQDLILNEARKNKITVFIYLINGVPLTGTVVAFDNFTITVKVKGRLQLLYKHAISTISVSRPILPPKVDINQE